jgi:ADP-ribose pyrophosphatase
MAMKSDLTEKLIESKHLFSGKVLTLRIDRVQLPNGAEAERECVGHPGAVAIVAIDEQKRVCMVRQFRHPVGEELWEIPAGKLAPGEDPLDCARRELREEAGIEAAGWRRLYSYFTTPGFSDEIMHLYLATGLSQGENHPDDDEFLEMAMIPLAQAYDRLKQGGIKDSKTLIGLLHVMGQD